MSNTNDGGPAFARASFGPEAGGNEAQEGMTLRDYFAAKAITGILPGAAVENKRVEEYAAWAYRLADAMLAERSK